jgi:hypothetical protein
MLYKERHRERESRCVGTSYSSSMLYKERAIAAVCYIKRDIERERE